MFTRNEFLSILALVTPLAVGAVLASPAGTIQAASASVQYAELCVSTTGVCTYVPMGEAPVFRDDVCWDGEITTLKGDGPCTGSSRPFHLTFGYVADPVTNEVLPLAPLPNTCDLGVCVTDQVDPGSIVEDGVACCNPKTGDCEAPDENGVCSFGDITWCETLEDNGDGTVTCHE